MNARCALTKRPLQLPYLGQPAKKPPITIALSRSTSKETAYQLERKLFDNGHASTVLETNLETNNNELIAAVKKAGLICLCVNYSTDFVDISFDTDQIPVETIYGELINMRGCK